MSVSFRPSVFLQVLTAAQRPNATDRFVRSGGGILALTCRELCEVSDAGNRFCLSLLQLPLMLSACSSGQAAPTSAESIQKADRILVDKSDRVMILYAKNTEIARYTDAKFGDVPLGHKQFEGDEKTPEGNYIINGRNPASRYHLSLRISYPNAADRAYAKSKGRSPGSDIFIHGQPNGSTSTRIDRDWTDGCIALSNAEIEILWKQVADGTPIMIRP